MQTLDISGMTQQFNGLEITAELLPFDGNFQQIPEKTYTKWFDYDLKSLRVKKFLKILIMIKLKILFR